MSTEQPAATTLLARAHPLPDETFPAVVFPAVVFPAVVIRLSMEVSGYILLLEAALKA